MLTKLKRTDDTERHVKGLPLAFSPCWGEGSLPPSGHWRIGLRGSGQRKPTAFNRRGMVSLSFHLKGRVKHINTKTFYLF